MIDIDFGRLSRMASRPGRGPKADPAYIALCFVVIWLGVAAVISWEYVAFTIGYWRDLYDLGWVAPVAYAVLVVVCLSSVDWPRVARMLLIVLAFVYVVAEWLIYPEYLQESLILLLTSHLYLSAVAVTAVWQLSVRAKDVRGPGAA